MSSLDSLVNVKVYIKRKDLGSPDLFEGTQNIFGKICIRLLLCTNICVAGTSGKIGKLFKRH